MEVILLDKVANLGQLGDKVVVKPGYGRNYLLPYGKAVRANAKNLQDFEARRAEFQAKADALLQKAQARAEQLAEKTFEIAANASDEGKLYGSVGPVDIARLVTENGFELAKKEVLMPTGPIHQIGLYPIDLQLHTDVKLQIQINVVPEK